MRVPTLVVSVLTGFRLKYVSTYLGGECLDRLQAEVCEYLPWWCLDRLQVEVCEYLPWW